MARNLELPDEIYSGLIEAADSGGVAPAEWIASRLPRRARPFATEEERKAARDRLFAHMFRSGRASDTDNEQIDADLAREYDDPHEPS